MKKILISKYKDPNFIVINGSFFTGLSNDDEVLSGVPPTTTTTTTAAPTTAAPTTTERPFATLSKQSSRSNEWLLAPNNLPTGLKWNIPV